MNWWKTIAANLIIWPALLLVVLAWFLATAGLTRLVEIAWCQFDPLARDLPEFCIGSLGQAEHWVFSAFGIVVFGLGAWLGPWLIDKWHTWRSQNPN